MKDSRSPSVRLVPYTRVYLDLSWRWLNDEEIKALTLTPDFTRQQQRAFFESLPSRTDYRVWGIELAHEGPIGVAGIKRIEGTVGEYWGYIGEKRFWGRGLGTQIVQSVETKALELGLDRLHLNVSAINPRAIALYRKLGYEDTSENAGVRLMEKQLSARDTFRTSPSQA